MMLNNYYNTIYLLSFYECGVSTWKNQGIGEVVDVNDVHWFSKTTPDTQGTKNMAYAALGCLLGRSTVMNSVYFDQIAFGSGSTPPTPADIKMEAEVSGVTVTSTTRNVAKVNGGFRLENTHTVKNTGTEAVTIREVGYLGYHILMSRSLLENPVTLQPGETGVITVTTEFPGPTA